MDRFFMICPFALRFDFYAYFLGAEDVGHDRACLSGSGGRAAPLAESGN